MIKCLESGPAPREARACALLVHGRGATADSMLGLARALSLEDVHYRAPQAPGSTWYPASFLAPLSTNESRILQGMAALRGQVEALDREGVPADRIVLIGFSQGACLATEFAARHARRYGGIAGLSGGLIGNVQLEGGEPPADKGFDYDGSLDGTPVFLGCSDVDPHIPVERVHQTARVLEDLGADVDLRIYPAMGHTVNDDELEAVRDLLAHVGAS